MKSKLLNIPKDLITKNGAVSEIVAFNMAKNSIKILNADLSIAVTGVAGPTGGSIDKPVGLVWIGIGTKERIITNKYQFNGDRLEIRQKTTHESLKLANKIILEI
jgi:PncC family amidohydrolase